MKGALMADNGVNAPVNFAVATALVLAWAWWALGYHIVPPPTPDQLYGCSRENEAPSGECR